MALGYPSRRALLQELTSRELAEWEAYAIIEPFGAPAAFWQAGVVTAAILNVNRAKSSDPVAKPSDFMPARQEWEEPEEEQADTNVVAQVRALFGRGRR